MFFVVDPHTRLNCAANSSGRTASIRQDEPGIAVVSAPWNDGRRALAQKSNATYSASGAIGDSRRVRNLLQRTGDSNSCSVAAGLQLAVLL